MARKFLKVNEHEVVNADAITSAYYVPDRKDSYDVSKGPRLEVYTHQHADPIAADGDYARDIWRWLLARTP